MRNINRVLLTALMCIIASSCTRRTGSTLGYTYSLYVSENAADYSHVSDRLDGWLHSSGLSSIPAPVGIMGDHDNDEINKYYMLQAGGRPIVLRIHLNPHSWQIVADIDYQGNFTPGELADARQACLKLWNDIFGWIASQPESNFLVTHDPDYFVNARRATATAYRDR